MASLTLDTPVQYVKGVGPARAEQLAQLGIETVEDLLTLYPRRFDLRKQAQPIGTLTVGLDSATAAGEIVDTEFHGHGRRPFFRCTLSDDTAMVDVKWFHGGYLRKQLRPGMRIAVSGRLSMYREMLEFVNPKFQVIWDPEQTDLSSDELLPVYPAGAGLSSPQIGKIIRNVLPDGAPLFDEWFDPDYRERRGLVHRPHAVAAMHRPEDRDQWKAARRRLAYDECFLMQLGIAQIRMKEVSRPAHPLAMTGQIDHRIRARFPFALTDAQNRAVAEITEDLARPRPMNRLLQGDVGSGKTVVALYAALLAVAHRKQVAILAPTEILARQHHRKIEQYLAGSRVRTCLLTGQMPPTERARCLDGLAEGTIHIAVGTHALLTEGVRFDALALAVVDEQHKFGVRQRSGLRGKGFAPHYLVMTATPIPRTLAMTVFGDLDVSVIDAAPPGRGSTTTRVVRESAFGEVLADVRQRLSSGGQAYFIYPLVAGNDQSQLTSAEDACKQLSAGPLKEFTVGMVHGQMPGERKEAVMADFRAGRIQALVASVVVEVGVDVPNANLMVIQHAERFGLAQLHQLRGRIGRGRQDATCYLVASTSTPQARERLDVLEATDDGFKVAEEDLRIRGPGEVFGTRQHGLPELKVADLVEDMELLRLARRDAFAIVHDDPDLAQPHHHRLRDEMLKTYAGRLDLLAGA